MLDPAQVGVNRTLRFWRANFITANDRLWLRRIDRVMVNREDGVPPIGKYNAGQKLLFWGIMSLICVLLLTGLAGSAGGLLWGQRIERQAQLAAQNANTLEQLQSTLTANADLVKRSTEASQTIRTATARLQQAQTQNLKDFRHELQSTAADRAGCVFPAGVMRSVSEARDRAAAAAAHGIVNPVPTATGGPADDR